MRIRLVQLIAALAASLSLGSAVPGQTLVGTLVANDGRALDGFGHALAADQDLLLVGSPRADHGAGISEAGSAYLFTKQAGVWQQTVRLDPSSPSSQARFGESVALEGNTLVIGSPGAFTGSVDTGRVSVFERSSGVWFERAVLSGSGSTGEDRFGMAVALSGTTIAIGAPDDDFHQAYGGRVFLYVRSATGWVEQGILSPALSTSPELFGVALVLQGDTLIVSAPGHEIAGVGKGAGAVHVYQRSGTTWTLVKTYLAGSPQAGERLGAALCLEGNRLAAGSPRFFSHGPEAGRVMLFELAGPSTSPVAEFYPDGVSIGANFGRSVALKSGLLAVAGPTSSGELQEEGKVWLFGESGNDWVDLDSVQDPKPDLMEHFGADILVVGDELIVGLEGQAALYPGQGVVNLYSLSTLPEFSSFCTGTSCPCGNDDAVGGCTNSTAFGARLSASGTLSLNAGDLSLSVDRLPPHRMAVLFTGVAMSPAIFGDGLSCVGPGPSGIQFLGLPQLVGPGGTYYLGPGSLAQLAGVLPGDLISLQGWYRDPWGPCNGLFNFSNALGLRFSP